MAKVVFTNAEGRCSVVTMAPGIDAIAEAKRVVPYGVPFSVVEETLLPVDNIYYNAWEHDAANTIVIVNMTKARNIHQDYMRAARIPLMSDLDTQYMIADEKGKPADKIAIAAKKQTLRDVTTDPNIQSAQTTTELKSVWPVALGPNPLI